MEGRLLLNKSGWTGVCSTHSLKHVEQFQQSDLQSMKNHNP